MSLGLKKYTHQLEQELSDAKFNVNTCDLNLIGVINVLSTSGIAPINLNLIFNLENKDEDGLFGKGFKLDLYKKIEINGNDNTIIIGDRSLIVDGEFFIEDDLGTIEIGKDTNICGKTHLACIEGRNINIGNDCLFSANITFRTGDSHSIINCETKQRINQSKNISIGNHVWIGNQVTILKGVNILDHTIIGTGSLVTKSCGLEGVILAGNPAKIVKTDITWIGERI